MQVIVAAVGRMRDGPLRAAWDDYVGRLGWRVELREVDSRLAEGPRRTAEEAALLRKAVAGAATLVALDPAGRDLDSPGLAARIAGWRDAARLPVAFMLGGADGLAADLVAEAELVLAFGRQTWPHLLARVMLAEQLYRCQTILAGHPYHR